MKDAPMDLERKTAAGVFFGSAQPARTTVMIKIDNRKHGFMGLQNVTAGF